jgi:AraC family transcriptional regulator, regulatory protein of adaptative response / DNA-3-methyladenine glycosylase II
VERVEGATYLRTLPGPAVLALELGRDHARAEARHGDEAVVLAVARRLLGTGGPAADAHLGRDPALRAPVAARPGLRAPGVPSRFEAGVRAILGQQVSVASARTTAGRLVAEHGERVDLHGLTRLFPSPAALAAAVLPGPRSRAAALRALAGAPDAGDLTALPGIGPWTAAYVALRTGDPDAFLPTDLVVRKGAARAGLPDDPRGLGAHAERWRPWRAVAAMHLWANAG